MTYLADADKLLRLLEQLWKGLGNTLYLFAATLILSLPLGLLVALLRRSRLPFLRLPISFYILIMRGTPLILQIFAVYFTIPLILSRPFDRMAATLIAFVLNYAAYFAEIFRGGIDSIAKGQWEAAKALGMNRAQVFTQVILMQVLRRVVLPVSNEVITLVKDTSMAFTLAYMEMFSIGKQIANSQSSFMPFVIAGAFYYLMNTVVAFAMSRCEKAMGYYR